MCGCLSHAPSLGTWPPTQACALTGNGTGDPLVHRLALIHWATPSRAGRSFKPGICDKGLESWYHISTVYWGLIYLFWKPKRLWLLGILLWKLRSLTSVSHKWKVIEPLKVGHEITYSEARIFLRKQFWLFANRSNCTLLSPWVPQYGINQ